MYNVRLYNYPSGAQLRLYKSIVHEDFEVEKKKSKKDFIFNPFDECMEWVEVLEHKERTEHDVERSIHCSVARTVNNVYYLSRSNLWNWFVTLTFNPEKVNSFDYDECTKKLSKWLQNCKRVCPDMKYLVVPEKHKSGRFHFHGLFANCDGLEFVESGKCTKSGEVIYNIGKYKLGFTTATKIVDNERCTKYICKYISKDLTESTPNKKRYWVSKNVNREEPIEVFLPTEDIMDLKEKLAPYIKHGKYSKGNMQNVAYLELEKDIDWSALLL